MGYVVGFADVPSWSFMVVDAMKSVWQMQEDRIRLNILWLGVFSILAIMMILGVVL